MLILCCGPDTFRATQRVKELEDAFRAKHDPSGTSIERFPSGKSSVDEIIERSLTVSLFSPMRFLRADGLIEHCSSAKAKALAGALTRDPDRVIVVSIEQEKPTNADLKAFADVPKLILNEYPLLRGAAFETWVVQTGETLGIHDLEGLKSLARECDGDSWLASNELLKMAAGGTSSVVKEGSLSGYEYADRFLTPDSRRYNLLSSEDRDQIAYPLFQQSIAALRVKDGDSQGLPPFVISKMRSVDRDRAARVMATSILLLSLSRAGFADSHEALGILP